MYAALIQIDGVVIIGKKIATRPWHVSDMVRWSMGSNH